jgi:hypothetical protein
MRPWAFPASASSPVKDDLDVRDAASGSKAPTLSWVRVRGPIRFSLPPTGQQTSAPISLIKTSCLSFRAHGTTPGPPARAEPPVATY